MRLVAGVVLMAASALAGPMTPSERDDLLKDLERTRQIYLDAMKNVSEAQWNFKPAPERWSVGECAAHIVATEHALFGFVTDKVMKSPVVDRAAMKNLQNDDGVKGFIVDRSKKAKAPPMLEPKGNPLSRDEAIGKFEQARAKTVEYVKTTQEDLRSHVGQGAQPMDAYQYLLMLSGHTERHVMQAKEVMASEGYPKN